MFYSSTQRRYWTFRSEEDLARSRADANRKFRSKAVAGGKVQQGDSFLLEAHEELAICKYYEKRLLDFCAVFKPAMPRSVVGTACMYFKRFYLNNSVMEYHPRIIMLTCAFLACKVDEFNVSSSQFVGNLRESPLGQEKALEQILEYELLLIQQLNFHLIVHNPYRPFEGILIDLKTRYPLLENPEVLRKTADDFLNRVALTDAYLLFTPSQIALAAIVSSASRAGINIESYLSECFMLKENRTFLTKILEGMKSMKNLIKKYELPRPEEVAALKQKLEKCHSPELSLNTNTKKRKIGEDDEYNSKKPKMDENGLMKTLGTCEAYSFAYCSVAHVNLLIEGSVD
ncbi:cyclin-H isoform X1 [Tympanuchus pallidicinctus]|uniref:cyclin-H isoform X1 n=1 Tax=Tympanuchus pallidicinctus TaxID=109042 RepID=UPI0022874E09|nr:cyclin-H isoform X1 [Tympanuchus pallidicinctus]